MSARKTVVIVDDEEEICETLRAVFEDEGYDVGVANDGAAALALLRRMPIKPCIVILDLMLPVLDGNAVYRAMKSDPVLAGVNVVISTSDPSLAPSGTLVIKKPVALNLLIDAVRRCC